MLFTPLTPACCADAIAGLPVYARRFAEITKRACRAFAITLRHAAAPPRYANISAARDIHADVCRHMAALPRVRTPLHADSLLARAVQRC